MSKFNNYKVFVGQDYGQMEIRVMAHMANDKAYIKVFESGMDPHAVVGHDLTGLSVEEITHDEDIRAMVKAIHFAMVYGKKPPNILAQILSEGGRSTIAKVQKYYDKYFETYSGVQKLIDGLIEAVREKGYCENIFGFRREIFIKKEEGDKGGFWVNQAVNGPIQGGAHQIELIAIAILHLKPKKYWTFKEVIMEVHDNLISRIKLKYLKEHYEQGQELLQVDVPSYIKKWFGFKLRVPLVADAKAGFRMGTMVKYKGEPIDEFLDKWREENKRVEAKVKQTLKKYATS